MVGIYVCTGWWIGRRRSPLSAPPPRSRWSTRNPARDPERSFLQLHLFVLGLSTTPPPYSMEQATPILRRLRYSGGILLSSNCISCHSSRYFLGRPRGLIPPSHIFESAAEFEEGGTLWLSIARVALAALDLIGPSAVQCLECASAVTSEDSIRAMSKALDYQSNSERRIQWVRRDFYTGRPSLSEHIVSGRENFPCSSLLLAVQSSGLLMLILVGRVLGECFIEAARG